MNELITSRQNDKVKYLSRLYRSRTRRQEGCFVLEGKRIISAALNSDAEFLYTYLTPSFAEDSTNRALIQLLEEKSQNYLLTDSIFAELADTVNPQGIIAVVKEPDFFADQFLADAEQVLVLDRIQDPGNMGTIIRTALAAGFDGIISLKGSVDIYNLKVLRATMGAIFNLPVWQKVTKAQFKKILTETASDFELIGADLTGEKYHFEHNYRQKTMVIIGNEASGIDSELLKLCDQLIKIPILGEIESLNAAIATSIIIYEITEQKIRSK